MPTATLFSHQTYTAVLMGKRVYETGYASQDLASAFSLDEEKWWNFVATHRARCADFCATSPDHRQPLRDIRGELTFRERRALSRGQAPEPASAVNAEAETAESSLL